MGLLTGPGQVRRIGLDVDRACDPVERRLHLAVQRTRALEGLPGNVTALQQYRMEGRVIPVRRWYSPRGDGRSGLPRARGGPWDCPSLDDTEQIPGFTWNDTGFALRLRLC